MNTRDEATIRTLIQLGLSATAAVSIVMLLLLGSISVLQLSGSAKTLVILVMLGSIFLVILGILYIHTLLQGRVRNWILGLVDVCRDYAGGDHTVRASVNGDDASALLAQSLNTLLDSQALNDSEQVEDVVHQQSYGVMALQIQVERLIHEVGSVTRGDLPLDAGVSSETLGMLTDSFAYMIEALAQGTKNMHSLAAHVTATVRQVVSQSEQLEEDSGEQLNQLEQLSEEVGSLAAFLQNVARTTHLLIETAEESIRHTQQGKTAVHQALEGQGHIQASIGEITNTFAELKGAITGIREVQKHLDDIVEHAQVLISNNSIHNAFTGDQNQAESGVVEDIRLLADRSNAVNGRLKGLSGQLQEIVHHASGKLDISAQHASEGMHLIAEASRALTALMMDTGRQMQLMRQFTQEADIEAPHGTEVAHLLEHLTEVVQQTQNQRLDQVAATSHLAKLAEELQEFTSKIHTPEIPLVEEGRQAASGDEQFFDTHSPREESHIL